MKIGFLSLVCALLLGFGFAGDASADNADVASGSQWCYSLLTSGNGAFIRPLVECFTDANQGILPTVAKNFLTNARADFLPIAGLMCLVAIAWFGLRIAGGGVKRLKAETLLMVVKIAGIMLFLNGAPTIYVYMINVIQQLSEDVAQVATGLHTSGFCATSVSYASTTSSTSWQYDLWQAWDCIFGYILGLAGDGLAISGIVSFLLMMVFSMGAGIVVFFAGIYLIIGILKAAFRFVHVYLMSILALTFLFCFGYLLVPLMVFKSPNIFEYFRKWLAMCIGFMITPVIMFGFMGMMLVALDISIFSGPYSIYCRIGGTTACSTASGGLNMFKNMTSNVIPFDAVSSGGNPYLQDNLKALFDMSLGGSQGMAIGSGSVISNPQCTDIAVGAGGHECNMQDATTTGDKKGSDYNMANYPFMARAGFEMVKLNMATLASGAGSTCTESTLGSGGVFAIGGSGGQAFYMNCPWIGGILVAFFVALLILYIMLSLLNYIPQLASSMAASVSPSGAAGEGAASVMQSKVFGEQAATRTANVTKDAALATSSRGSRGFSDSVEHAVDDMTGGDI